MRRRSSNEVDIDCACNRGTRVPCACIRVRACDFTPVGEQGARRGDAEVLHWIVTRPVATQSRAEGLRLRYSHRNRREPVGEGVGVFKSTYSPPCCSWEAIMGRLDGVLPRRTSEEADDVRRTDFISATA